VTCRRMERACGEVKAVFEQALKDLAADDDGRGLEIDGVAQDRRFGSEKPGQCATGRRHDALRPRLIQCHQPTGAAGRDGARQNAAPGRIVDLAANGLLGRGPGISDQTALG
jgi:hypothetical protein